MLGIQITADQTRDISATIRKRISHLRILQWDSTLRSFEKPDPTCWCTYRKITATKEARKLPPLCNGLNTVTPDKGKVDLLATTFAEIHSSAASRLSKMENTEENFTVWLGTTEHENTQSIPLSPDQIKKYINHMESRKAPDTDGLSILMLKHASRKILCQIYYIFPSATTLSYFPAAWKISKVIPIPKPGKPTSYRPISLLPILGKLLEKCILLF